MISFVHFALPGLRSETEVPRDTGHASAYERCSIRSRCPVRVRGRTVVSEIVVHEGPWKDIRVSLRGRKCCEAWSASEAARNELQDVKSNRVDA